MLSLFANPANMVLGAALISSPIIIHLINRMRYRRVRWAAMEFLLKAQTRNKRRLIIEQLLLLLLRIILVLLAALLLARFLGAGFTETFAAKPTTHFVLLDDRLSMSDAWKKGDAKTSAFEVGKTLVVEQIIRKTQVARTAPTVVVRRLSDPNNELFEQKLNDQALAQLRELLNGMTESSQQHLELADGVEAARQVFDNRPADQHTLYIVSDFRERHWFQPENTKLINALKKLSEKNVKIEYIDAVTDPARSADKQAAPPQHDNLAVTELRPETRVAAFNTDVQFKVAVANYGINEFKNVRVTVKVNGIEDGQASQMLPRLEPGKVVEKSFSLRFREEGDGKDTSAQRFAQVTAQVENEDQGVPGDNVRYAVIEVRKQIPILVIDGDPRGAESGGDTFHLTTVLNATTGYDVVAAQKVGGGYRLRQGKDDKTVKLGDLDLKQYACIYLVNCPELEDDKEVRILEAYVREGGGLAFFMGDRITNGDYYNKKLYREGKGLFPAPLAEQPSRQLSDEEVRLKADLNRKDPQYQFFIRNDDHPMFRFEVDAEQNKVLRALIGLESKDLMLTRYHPVARFKMQPNEQVAEALTLPNSLAAGDYEATVNDLIRALPTDDARMTDDEKKAMQDRKQKIRNEQAGNSLPKLATAVEELLEVPALKKFWESPDEDIVKMKKQVVQLKETLQLGDPLMITKNFGRGRVVAVLTSAGRKWHNWPTLKTYPVVMLGIQRYLTSLGGDADYLVGQTKAFEEDSTRYESDLRYARLSDAPEGDKNAKQEEGKLSGREQEGGRLIFDFDQAKKPGVYVFDLRRRGAEAGQPPEKRALAFNVDTVAESDLRRAAQRPIDEVAPTGAFLDPDVKPDTTRDLSESAWFYLLFLVILVVEQALAVHLSFHLKSGEALAPPQAVQPQPT